MSEMVLYGVRKDGEVERVQGFHNAHRGAMLVWRDLGNRYYGPFDIEVEKKEALTREDTEVDHGGMVRSWKLRNDPRAAEFDWVVMLSTFDHFMVLGRPDMEYCAKQYQRYRMLGKGESHFAHLDVPITKMIEAGYEGFCFNMTDVNRNPWLERKTEAEIEADPEGGAYKPYNINTGKKHIVFRAGDRPITEVTPRFT
jgi:hypothetical protein